MFEALDAAAKAWWSSFAPAGAAIAWQHRSKEGVYALDQRAPVEIAAPLIKAMHRLEVLSGWQGGWPVAETDPGGLLQLGVMHVVVERALTLLDERIAPLVDLAAGDRVRLDSGAPARILDRQGSRLVLELPWQGMQEKTLFHGFLQRIPSPSENPFLRGPPSTPPAESDGVELDEALLRWEDALDWIEDGWDCLEEYQIDVGWRKVVDNRIEQLGGPSALADDLRQRLNQADKRFRAATKPARLSIFDCGPKFQVVDEEHITWLPLNEFDPERYWYFYRWQPDCPCLWREHDVYSYQQAVYGLDFHNMTDTQLRDAVRGQVARWKTYD